MVVIFQTTQKVDSHLSNKVKQSPKTSFDHRGEYKVDFPYRLMCNTNAIPMSAMTKIDKLIDGRWGWNFIPHDNMDWNRDDWYERQDAYVSFENRDDAITVALSINFD